MTTIHEDRDLAVRWLIGLLDEDRVQTDDVLASARANPRVHRGLLLGLSHLALEQMVWLHPDEDLAVVLKRYLLARAAEGPQEPAEGPHDV